MFQDIFVYALIIFSAYKAQEWIGLGEKDKKATAFKVVGYVVGLVVALVIGVTYYMWRTGLLGGMLKFLS